mmetsp:Transcript_16758/g.40855  ORF Transcript_16758/g.40855 Transcript_16758/m.40855 type:complete len:402 (-) Transcript_16758:215-1420(-)|eukprot:CAMPEP_0113654952 /NCGR_PEP_ID=MMETSP0017_2-20120614/29431_1 /TAXON_ID=2856 /ORGANISM="Cylindrotheca closterium" /LENGTH=401 /DNA_ID=CAMNT_0000568135 /DNA_START=91 /DNA_END=1296 /DNA_ORIENTATION=+ /assembly_acc=CAM_ASM_000147
MSLNTGEEAEHFQAKPVTVSSTSSMETAASFNNDRANMIGTQIVSNNPSLIRTALPTTHSTEYATQDSSAPTGAAGFPSSISLVRNPLRSPSTGVVIPSVASPNAVPEFLYQLTKMLTDNNRDIIEWSTGKIEVHNPHKLQSHVLNRYFRHSKFASFQRQLNYFGFRKLAGKGKMAPCSYVNDATTNELRSLLHIKRKTGNELKSKNVEKKGGGGRIVVYGTKSIAGGTQTAVSPFHHAGDSTASQAATGRAPQHTQQAIARVAVGKGIRHGFSLPGQPKESRPLPATVSSTSALAPTPVQSNLSALQTNYQTSLQQDTNHSTNPTPKPVTITATASGGLAYVPGSLRRDDSLVDLAMIPLVDPSSMTNDEPQGTGTAGNSMPFIDFPWDPSMFQDEEPLT